LHANLILAAGVLAVDAAGLLAAPSVLATHALLGAAILVLFALSAPIHWGLIHEAIHGLLATGSRSNRAAGRALSVLLLYSFDVVRLGHLLHHSDTGHQFDRPDLGLPGETRWRAALRHYGHVLGGHYVVTAVLPVLILLPQGLVQRMVLRASESGGSATAPVRDAALRWFGQRRRVNAIRADVLAGAGLVGLAAFLYGPAWPALAAALYGRAVLISLLDNMPHYGTATPEIAHIPAFRLPRWLSPAVMNHHLHRWHHQRPNLAWHALPEEFRRTGGRYDLGYLTGILRQLRGPNWASEGG